jgi:hypothetical protein
MKQIYLVILLSFITGCSQIDKQQALASCKFDAIKAKQTESDQSDYMESCMENKGYSINYMLGCSHVYTVLSECWTYTWRVFL